MTDPVARSTRAQDYLLKVELEVRTSDPRLLEGLEVWLRLGLVSDAWVKQVARSWLCCPLPEPARSPAPIAPSRSPEERSPAPLQAITAELSVVWLLLVGAFLVVVSSALLAASLWSQVGVLGQYGILLLYTVTFWAAALWTGRQERLRLTGRALRGIVTLLLPVNAWAADGLGLPLAAWLVAGLLWVAIAWTMAGRRSVAVLVLLACGLHWNWDAGWAWAGVSIYAGAIALAAAVPGRWQLRSGGNRAIAAGTLLILLLRALATDVAALVDVALVMAVAGLLLLLEARSADRARTGLGWIGRSLVALGWLLGQSAGDAPWQQLELAAIAGGLLWQRLARLGRRFDLLALTVVGLAALAPLGALLPLEWRSSALKSLQGGLLLRHPSDVLGLLWLPYPLVPGGLAGWQQRRDRPGLARFGAGLAIGLLLLLNLYALALWPHNVRLLPLSLCGSLVILVAGGRSPLGRLLPRLWVGLTVTYGVVLAYAIGRFWWPTTGQPLAWAQWGVSLAVILGGITAWLGQHPQRQRWAKACWWAGLGLTGLTLLQMATIAMDVAPDQPFSASTLSWLVLPVGFLALAARGPIWAQRPARILGPIGLVLAQGLPLGSPHAQILPLAIAAGAMGVSTGTIASMQHGWAALMAIGFGWTALAYGLGLGIGDWSGLPGHQWMLAQAALLGAMWVVWWWALGQSNPLVRLYGRSVDRWATLLAWLSLPTVAFYLWLVHQGWEAVERDWQLGIVGLQIGAIALRVAGSHWPGRPKPLPGVLWVGAGAVELGAIELVRRLDGSATAYAAATLTLAWGAMLVTERFGRRFTSARWIPLAYGLLAIGWRLFHWDAWTGLLMVGVALVGLRVAARSPRWPLLSYESLALASWGWGETALYWADRLTTGGTTADGLVLLTGVATALAWMYDLGRNRWGRSVFALSAPVLTATATGHWLVGTVLALLLGGTTNPSQPAIALGVAATLTAYPWARGWRSSGRSLWVDLAVLQTIGWVSLGRQVLNGSHLDGYWAAIAGVMAIGLVLLARLRPERLAWERSALWLPIGVTLITLGAVSSLSLMVVAAAYGAIAALTQRRRLYYLGAIFATLAIWQLLRLAGSIDPLPYALPIGGCAILAAEIDPSWQGATDRRPRHTWRLCGAGAIALAAYVNHSSDWLGLGLALGAIGVGIRWRVRAYLFVGLLLLGATTIANFIELNARVAFLKWLVGLAIGTGLIWVAATFETQRDRANALIQRWSDDLDRWD
ncbi:MAG: hypothetical protein EA001_15035 [Oscillatoriales cyanobacterium]|nr:MAG: hypothetical protein EA001_15035 [Oscillatoriales cyanobacterium]